MLSRSFCSIIHLPAFCALYVIALGGAAAAVTIPTVPVGNGGNAGDPRYSGIVGSVAYDYKIGKYEVTNAQYAEFLNAKAASDPLHLYNTSMDGSVYGGISRSGSTGSFTYSLKANMADKPVVFVSWYDAARFTNWLHNGQGTGDTETGAYTLLGGTPVPSNAQAARNVGATWFLPSTNEWYKAAFYDPSLAGGSGGYWRYATQSDSAPTIATATPTGDIANPGPNVANYAKGADWNGQDGNATTVGSALSESYYGTADQSGNVWEWTENFGGPQTASIAGGSWFSATESQLAAAYGAGTLAASESINSGFRVATIPEPSTYLLAACSIIGLALFRSRRASHG